MAKKRKSGEGMLRKRSDGRWEARVVIGYDEKNLPITKNVTALNLLRIVNSEIEKFFSVKRAR